MKVLIAEDDENSRLLLESILLSLGHTVTLASDGNEAWQAALQQRPDLLITDILMPGIDGFDLCRRMRGNAITRNIPIIVYSATYIDRRDEDMALAVGANRFLIKPVEPLAMVRIINEVMQEGGHAPEGYSEGELDRMHVERLQAKLRRKLIQLGRERSALRTSEERLQLALSSAHLGVFDWQLDTQEVKLDSAASRLLLDKAGVQTIAWHDLVSCAHVEDRGDFASLLHRMQKPATTYAMTCRFATQHGDTRHLELHVRRIPNESFSSPPRVVGVVRDITNELSLSERLHKTVTEFDHMTRHDALTNLPNRRLFNDLLDHALNPLHGGGAGIAVLLIDLDSFKVINDSLGHAFGDALLVLLAERLQSALPSADCVARIGSDEFAVIVHHAVDREYIANLAQKLLFALADPTDINDEQLTVSASIGIACVPDDGADKHSLLKAADNAMYAAKAQGRNRYCFHTQAMSARANEVHSVEQGLKRALENHQLRVHYQPQVNLADGELIGVEALVRWEHPTEGLIAPIRFIPIAETSGLIERIGRWVLRAACAECADWLPSYPSPLRLSVNVSARQLVDSSFIDNLIATLHETHFPAACLELELTESTLQLVETSPRLLNEIKALGVSIAIDDFGTGYSSLSVLKNLPIDRLKIDQSFVRDMPTDPDDIAIVEAIIGISHNLGLSVIAEGVETEDQLAILQRLGCEIGQGYLFSRPLPPQALRGWLVGEKNPAIS